VNDIQHAKNMKAVADHPLAKLFGMGTAWCRWLHLWSEIKASADFVAQRFHELVAKGERVAGILRDPDLTAEAKARRVAEATAEATSPLKAYFEKRLADLRAGVARAEAELSMVPGDSPEKSVADELARQFHLQRIYEELKGMDVADRLTALRDGAMNGDPAPFIAMKLGFKSMIPQEEHFQIYLALLNEKVRPDAVTRAKHLRETLDAETLLFELASQRASQLLAEYSSGQRPPATTAAEIDRLETRLGEWNVS
jgi:hypothetical protein